MYKKAHITIFWFRFGNFSICVQHNLVNWSSISLLFSSLNDVLLLVDVLREVFKVGAEVPELEGGVDDGPDGVHLAAVDALHPVGANLDVDAGEVPFVNPAANVVCRLQN